VGLVESTFKANGLGDMARVVVPHPLGGIGPEAIREKADAAFPDIFKAATQWKPVSTLPPMKKPYPAERFQFKGDVKAVNELFFEKGWSLGLPIIPPTPESIAEMLKGTNRSPDEILWEVPPRKCVLTVELLAAHAVMAGCKPEYMPLLISIVEAMKDPKFNWAGQTTTTNPTFPLIIVNGPIVKELGIASDQGAAGGGFHPNASIGYVVNLIGDIVGGSKAPDPDKSTLGQAANFVATVIGENTEALPKSWKPLNADRGYSPETNTVTVVPVEGMRNMNIAQPDTAKGILDVIAVEMETLGPNNTVLDRGKGTDVALLFCPQHAAAIAREGWTKKDIQQYLYNHGRIPYEKWKLNLRAVHFRDPWYAKFGPGDMVPVVDSPDNILIAVVGGVGTHTQYLTGFAPAAVTRQVK
jgi:hypothetical protein